MSFVYERKWMLALEPYIRPKVSGDKMASLLGSDGLGRLTGKGKVITFDNAFLQNSLAYKENQEETTVL